VSTKPGQVHISPRFGPWFAGALFDITGSSRAPFLIATLFCVAGSICFWLTEPRSSRSG
jgi:cyanate permease